MRAIFFAKSKLVTVGECLKHLRSVHECLSVIPDTWRQLISFLSFSEGILEIVTVGPRW